jgi:hypothetical protein
MPVTKKQSLFSSIAFLFLAIGTYAQTAKIDPVEQNLRRHVEYLSSDRLEGRRTGEKGATLAASYVADQFSKLRLQPGNRAGRRASYYQEFPFVTGVEMARTGNSFALEYTARNGERTRITDLIDARPVPFSMNGRVTGAPIAFVGYGITSRESNYDDYAGRDVKGKIVLVLDGNPENDSPHSAFGRFNVHTKALTAKDNGAIGMMVVTRQPDFPEEKLTRMTFDQTLGESALPTLVVSQKTAAAILGVDEKDILTISAHTAAKVKFDLPDTNPVVTYSVNLVKRDADASNVIGILPGSDPALKDEAIVIGAHYDHLGHGGQGSLDVNSTAIHHGADDNASGTAAMIELARYFASQKNNKRTLIFMAFSGEEEGLLGSQYYVSNPVWPLEKTVAMVNLDMVGRLNGEKLNVGGIGTATEFRPMVEAENAKNGPFAAVAAIPASSRSAAGFALQLNEDGFGPSDHSSFYSKKVPVLFFFTGTHNDYHKPSDTYEKINYSGLNRVVGYVTAIVRSIDGNPQRPTYTVAKSSGNMGRTSGFNVYLGTVPNYADATDGLLLDGVRDDSPAAKAGLKPGDKIVHLAGKDIRNVMDYTYVLGEMRAGQEYDVIVLRGGQRLPLKIVPAARK